MAEISANAAFYHSWATISTPSTRASPGLNQASWSDVSSPTGESPGVCSVRRRAATVDARNFELEKAQALISDMFSGGKRSCSSASSDGRRRQWSEPPKAPSHSWTSSQWDVRQMPVCYSTHFAAMGQNGKKSDSVEDVRKKDDLTPRGMVLATLAIVLPPLLAMVVFPTPQDAGFLPLLPNNLLSSNCSLPEIHSADDVRFPKVSIPG
eukprot:symbB.v1.2.020786.t1/scaffold1766.1/size102418/5